MQKNVNYISTDLIFPNVYQPRKHFNEETIDELAQSIKTYGIIQPLSVRKLGENHYELIAGERRLRAAKKIGLAEVPAIIINISDSDSAAIALLENLQREDLNFIEEAEAYSNLIKDHNYTQEQLAQIIGKKQSTIANKLRILKLSPEIRNNLIENKLTERHARALLKLPTEELQNKVLKSVISKGLNVKKTEEYINKELIKLNKGNMADDKKKGKIKAIFSYKIYVNTIKQMFEKFGVHAKYQIEEEDEDIKIVVSIPKPNANLKKA